MTDLTAENARLREALEGLLTNTLSNQAQRGQEAVRVARAALAASAPAHDCQQAELVTAGAVQDADIAAIESGGKRWHGEDHRIVSVRWEPYKPDGQRQMKAKGRWQEQVGSGDYWRWHNCDRPSALRALAGETE